MACIHREYPNKLGQHVLNSDADVRPPRELTPAFYGCYDWHSAVHGHWMLIRLARTFPDAPLADRLKYAVGRNLTAENPQKEQEYLQGRAGRVLSGLMDWPGCCDWPRSCAHGMIRTLNAGRPH